MMPHECDHTAEVRNRSLIAAKVVFKMQEI